LGVEILRQFAAEKGDDFDPEGLGLFPEGVGHLFDGGKVKAWSGAAVLLDLGFEVGDRCLEGADRALEQGDERGAGADPCLLGDGLNLGQHLIKAAIGGVGLIRHNFCSNGYNFSSMIESSVSLSWDALSIGRRQADEKTLHSWVAWS
jgi:hypothetical protein